MKIRIRFRKFGVMKFIGHLDIMRFFQKAIRRSDIDICYSEGFSPHQIMSFAAPLGVGLTSDGEYVDIEVHTSRSSQESIDALNAAMVDGMEITGYVQLPDSAKTAMATVSAADYEIYYKDGYDSPCPFEQLQEQFQRFYEEPEAILITKKTKKSEKVVDIKPLIYEFRLIPPQEHFSGKPAYSLNVSTGSTDNLKPELVLEAFYRHLGVSYDAFALQIHRKEVYYTDESGQRKCLLDAGREI